MTKDSFLSEHCALMTPCCGEANAAAGQGDCATVMQDLTAEAQFDSAAADACVADMRAQSSRVDFCSYGPGYGVLALPTEPDVALEPCLRVFPKERHGSAAPGEPCDTDSDCAKPAEGIVACVNTCLVLNSGKVGEPCIGSSAEGRYGIIAYESMPPQANLCRQEDGLYCDGERCARLLEAGEACLDSSQCIGAHYCSGEGKCTPKVGNGMPCADQDACLVETQYCESSTATCQERRPTGASCEDSSQCGSYSCDEGTCVLEQGFELHSLC